MALVIFSGGFAISRILLVLPDSRALPIEPSLAGEMCDDPVVCLRGMLDAPWALQSWLFDSGRVDFVPADLELLLLESRILPLGDNSVNLFCGGVAR